MQPQAKGHPGLLATPEAKKKARDRFSPRALEQALPCRHLDLGLLVSRTIREKISVVLSYLSLGTLLQQLPETNTNQVIMPTVVCLKEAVGCDG